MRTTGEHYPETEHEGTREAMSSIRDPHADQPLPEKGVLPVQQILIDAIAARRDLGIRKYGRPLETGNGRDMLTDAWEEAIDLLVYLTGMRLERGDDLGRETEPAAFPAGDPGGMPVLPDGICGGCGNPVWYEERYCDVNGDTSCSGGGSHISHETGYDGGQM